MSLVDEIYPIIRDTSPNSVSIVLHGDVDYLLGKVTITNALGESQSNTQYFSAGSDYSSRFTFDNLVPNTEYDYTTYVTKIATPNFKRSKYSGKFKTSDNSANNYCFVYGSCRYFVQLFDLFSIGALLSDKAFGVMVSQLNSPNPPQMLLQLGDQIYTDITESLPDLRVKSYDNIRRLYRTSYKTLGCRTIMASIETKCIADDHEYRDNGNPELGATEPDIYANCLNAINVYQHPNGPLLISDHPELHYNIAFQRGPAHFFMCDTRFSRYTDSNGVKHIMSEDNWQQLEAWLENNPNEIKFLVSPVSLFMQIYDDSWNGYPGDRKRLVDKVISSGVKNLFVLTGDAHAALSAEYKIYDNNVDTGSRIVELLSSGIKAIFHDGPEDFFNQCQFGNYLVKSDEDLESLRSRVISSDNFASVQVNPTSVKISYYDVDGDLLSVNQYPVLN